MGFVWQHIWALRTKPVQVPGPWNGLTWHLQSPETAALFEMSTCFICDVHHSSRVALKSSCLEGSHKGTVNKCQHRYTLLGLADWQAKMWAPVYAVETICFLPNSFEESGSIPWANKKPGASQSKSLYFKNLYFSAVSQAPVLLNILIQNIPIISKICGVDSMYSGVAGFLEAFRKCLTVQFCSFKISSIMEKMAQSVECLPQGCV